MKCRRKMIALLLLISFLMVPWSTLLISMPQPLKGETPNSQILAETPLDNSTDPPEIPLDNFTNPPLDINGDGQLAAAASAGDGSRENPYIIENRMINASGLGMDGIRIQNTTAHFVLRDCTVINADAPYAGLSLINVVNARIEHNTVYYNEFGICLQDSRNNTLICNGAYYNYGYGIDLEYSDNNILIGNTAQGNEGQGIRLEYSDSNCLIGNTAYDNDGHGIYLGGSNGNTLTGNTAYDTTIAGFYQWHDSDGGTWTYCSGHCHNGIQLYLSHDNTLTGNTLYNYSTGIQVCISHDNTLVGNTVDNNLAGIRLEKSTGNKLIGNAVNNEYYCGIGLDSSDHNILIGNTANDNEVGIQIYFSDYNTLIRNTANNTLIRNTVFAAIILGDSNYNNVIGNTVSGTDYLYDPDNSCWTGEPPYVEQGHGIYECICCNGNRFENNECIGLAENNEGGDISGSNAYGTSIPEFAWTMPLQGLLVVLGLLGIGVYLMTRNPKEDLQPLSLPKFFSIFNQITFWLCK